MRGRIIGFGAVGFVLVGGAFFATPASADSMCQGISAAAVCAAGDTSGGSVRVSSDGGGTAPGGVVTVSGSDAGTASVAGQGNATNPAPANGWVIASGSSAGPDVSCGVGGEPVAGSGCNPAP